MPDDEHLRREADQHRLERLEGEIGNIGQRVSGAETKLDSLTRAVDRLTASLDGAFKLTRENSQTRWPVIFGVLMIVATVVGGFLSGYLRDLNRIEGTQRKVIDQIAEHVKDGHPYRVEQRVEANEAEIAHGRAELAELRDQITETRIEQARIDERLKYCERTAQ